MPSLHPHKEAYVAKQKELRSSKDLLNLLILRGITF